MLRLVLTDKSQQKLHKALHDLQPFSCTCGWQGTQKELKVIPGENIKEGVPLSFIFDYGTQEAIIQIEDKVIPLEDYEDDKRWLPPTETFHTA
jgi:hypothetical protein